MNTQSFLAIPQVKEWADEINKPNTKSVYVGKLRDYWTYLSAMYPDIYGWISKVRQEQKSDENNVRLHWAYELKHYMNEYIVPRTGKKMGFAARQIIVAAVIGFLKHYLGEQAVMYNFKLEPTAEEFAKQDKTAMSFEEVLALYKAARTPRDRAIILVLCNGVGAAEMTQLMQQWRTWFPKDNQPKAPLRISLVRQKKLFAYHATLWEDACDALRDLYNERMKETGGEVQHLFVNETAPYDPLTESNLEGIMATLRERAGLLVSGEKYASQRVRVHGFRHYFRTQGKMHHVDPEVLEFCLGHRSEKYGYDRSHLEQKWCQIVEKELDKMKDVLNIVTGRASVILEDKEADIRAKAAKDTYKTLIETGVLKPETLSNEVLRIIAKKVGVTFEKMVLLAEVDTLQLPKETQERLALFDMVAGAVDLNSEIYHKYMAALKVMKPTSAKSAWENHVNWWLRVEVGSDDYMQALADGFVVEDKEDKMRILRKSKA